MSIEEQLAEAYCRWEIRGRGWQVWDEPVALEPAYEHFEPRVAKPEVADDGRIPTFLSRAVSSLQKLLAGRPSQPPALIPADPSDDAAAVPDGFRRDRACIEWRLNLSPTLPESYIATQQLLLSLSHSSAPLSVELMGAAGKVTVQWATDPDDAELFQQQWSSHLPDIGLVRASDGLDTFWCDVRQRHALIVEFGLSLGFMRPLACAQSISAGLLSALVAAAGIARDDERVVVQVLVQSAHAPWASGMLRSAALADDLELSGESAASAAQVRDKLSRPLLAVVVRAAAQAADADRTRALVRGVATALAIASEPTGNELIPLLNDGYGDELHEADLLSRQTHRSGMILNCAEAALFAQPPSGEIRSPALVRDSRKTRAAPAIATGPGLEIGVNVHQGHTTLIRLSSEQRVRHMHIVGASGTGKSSLLLRMLLADIEAGEGVALLDPHGDLLDQVLGGIPESRWNDVIVFDPADETYTVGFNVLGAHSELEKTLLASDLVGIFRRLSTSWGDQMSSVLGNAVLAILESDRGGTLADLRQFLIEPPFRTEFLKSVRDSEVVYYWQKQFPLLVGRPQAPLLTRLDALLRPKPIRRMVSQRESCLDLTRVVNEGKIFLARLSIGAIGEENASLLGALLMSKFHQVATARQAVAESERRNFWLYTDEFHHFVTPSVAHMLSGARKYRMGLVLAHQEFRQLEVRDADVASAALTNAYTRICFRVGDADARKLADGFASFGADDLQNLRIGEAICRVERADGDFNLTTSLMPAIDEKAAERNRSNIIERSRAQYAKPVEHAAIAPEPAAVKEPDTADRKPPATEAATGEVSIPISPPLKPAIDVRAPQPPAPPVVPRPAPTPGRGGREHKYLQEFIKCFGEGLGYRGSIEFALADGGFVDVTLDRDNVSIACEISISTPTADELKNIRKCVAAAYTHVIVVSPDVVKLARIRSRVEAEFSPDVPKNLRFATPDELCTFLRELETATVKRENVTVRGYRVKTTHKRLSTDEQRAVEQRVAQVVAGSIRRLRAGKSSKRI
ncbi:MAG: type IV secretion system DNA-binding domain-containing protein [Deltaproteobacteria bacterium]|nr:type IV secretion system DNA-binding domain-containing protein [Deltaproteobacteria bacterium]